MLRRKRRLNELEIAELRTIMDTAISQRQQVSIRGLARYFGVNRPSIVKALDGMGGSSQNQPAVINPAEKIKIEGYTTRIGPLRENNV